MVGIHAALWIALFVIRPATPRDSMRYEPTRIQADGMDLRVITDTGTPLFGHFFNGWPEWPFVKFLVTVNALAWTATLIVEAAVDLLTSADRYQLSVMNGFVFFGVSSLQWFSVGWAARAIIARATAAREPR